MRGMSQFALQTLVMFIVAAVIAAVLLMLAGDRAQSGNQPKISSIDFGILPLLPAAQISRAFKNFFRFKGVSQLFVAAGAILLIILSLLAFLSLTGNFNDFSKTLVASIVNFFGGTVK